MANSLLTKYGLLRTRCGSKDCCGCRFFCRSWLHSGRCISRRSLLCCCRFNTGRRVWRCCRNNCDYQTISQTMWQIIFYMICGKTLVESRILQFTDWLSFTITSDICILLQIFLTLNYIIIILNITVVICIAAAYGYIK